MMIGFLLVACTGAKTADSETGTATTDSETDVVLVNGNLVLADYQTQKGIANATVQMGDQTATSDAAGQVTLSFPSGKGYEVVATTDGYPDRHGFNVAWTSDFELVQYWPSSTAESGLSKALGLSVDPKKGLMVVTVFGPDGTLPGTTVDLSVPYEKAVVPDPSAGIGLVEGNTTLENGNSWVIFLNVDAGDVEVNVQPPSGSCSYDPNGQGATVTPVIYGGALSTIDTHCK